MGKNFKDFVSSVNCENNEGFKKDASNLVSKYINMSKEELMTALLSEVQRQKMNGTFNKEQLLNMLNLIKQIIPIETYNEIYKTITNL